MRLICIDDETDILNFGEGVKELTYGKEYQILTFYERSEHIGLVNDRGIESDYNRNRFVTLQIFREIQLNKIGI